MMLEPAHGAGGVPAAGRGAAAPASAPDGEYRPEGEHWHRRRLLERQLHDGPALRLSALALQLGLLGQKLPGGERNLQGDIDELQAQLHTVLEELRAIADRIYPPLLYEAGLGPALHALAGRAAATVRVDVPDDRFDPAVEAVAYFAVLECVEALGPDASTVQLRVRREPGDLLVDVASRGLRHDSAVVEQLRRLGDVTNVLVEPTTGTITMRIPCE
jgi:signal transduction histidine kinase